MSAIYLGQSAAQAVMTGDSPKFPLLLKANAIVSIAYGLGKLAMPTMISLFSGVFTPKLIGMSLMLPAAAVYTLTAQRKSFFECMQSMEKIQILLTLALIISQGFSYLLLGALALQVISLIRTPSSSTQTEATAQLSEEELEYAKQCCNPTFSDIETLRRSLGEIYGRKSNEEYGNFIEAFQKTFEFNSIKTPFISGISTQVAEGYVLEMPVITNLLKPYITIPREERKESQEENQAFRELYGFDNFLIYGQIESSNQIMTIPDCCIIDLKVFDAHIQLIAEIALLNAERIGSESNQDVCLRIKDFGNLDSIFKDFSSGYAGHAQKLRMRVFGIFEKTLESIPFQHLNRVEFIDPSFEPYEKEHGNRTFAITHETNLLSRPEDGSILVVGYPKYSKTQDEMENISWVAKLRNISLNSSIGTKLLEEPR